MVLKIALASTVALTLAACGTSESNSAPDQEVGGGQTEPDKTSGGLGIYEGKLATNLVSESIGKYIFSIQNNKEEDVTLVFPSSQQFDYTISNPDGDVLYTYSMDKSFMMMISEKTLKAGEKLDIEVDATEFFPQLEEGTYTLDIWATIDSEEKLSASVNFTIGEEAGNVSEGSQGSGLPVLMTSEVVEFVGLADNHSAEVINENGDFEVYQIFDETVKSVFNELSNGDTITISYYINEHNQKVVESVE